MSELDKDSKGNIGSTILKNVEKRQSIHVRIVLENELLDAFLAIKKELGMKNNTEIVRFLIKEKAKELVEKSD